MRLSYVLFFVLFVVASIALRYVQTNGTSLRDAIQALIVGAVATAVYAGIERSTKRSKTN